MVHAVETMAFVGELPWHGLGIEIDQNMPIREIQTKAQLDWEVRLEPNCKADGTEIEGSFFIERDDGRVLGRCVTERYLPLQNTALFDFFEPFIGSGKLYIHTCGSLFDGRKVWVMASPLEGFTLDGNDTVVSNCVFTLDHTGRCANSVMFSPVRVVCNNTWTLAQQSASDIVKHNHKVVFDPEIMYTALDLFHDAFVNFEQDAKAMARRVLSGAEELDYFQHVFGGKLKTDKRGRVHQSKAVNKAIALARGYDMPSTCSSEFKETLEELKAKMSEATSNASTELTLPNEFNQWTSIRRPTFPKSTHSSLIFNAGNSLSSARADTNRITAWGAFQTVTNIIDHNPVRQPKSRDHQLDVSLYGGPQNIKARALLEALDLVHV